MIAESGAAYGLLHTSPMGDGPSSVTPETHRRIVWIQVFTIGWMSAEAALSLVSALSAGSPALLAFGGDSAIELLSASVVLWRFRSRSTQPSVEERAHRIAGGLLFGLAIYVGGTSGAVLLGYSDVRPSYLGIAVLLAAALVMPWLARQKRRLSALSWSAALRADAVQSALCGYMAWIALAGLVMNAVWRIRWADPLAALVLIPIIVHEGWDAVKGRSCRNC